MTEVLRVLKPLGVEAAVKAIEAPSTVASARGPMRWAVWEGERIPGVRCMPRVSLPKFVHAKRKRREAPGMLEGTFMPVKDAQSITMAPIFADGSLNPCPERSIFGFDVYGLAT